MNGQERTGWRMLFGDGGETAQAAAAPDTGGGQPAPDAGEHTAERAQAFRALITGAYRDLYTQETQRIINQRFKETKELRERVERQAPVMALLRERFGTEDAAALRAHLAGGAAQAGAAVPDGAATLSPAAAPTDPQTADERGTADKDGTATRLDAWLAEEAALQNGDYPGFDLRAELRAEPFRKLLAAGVPVRTAFEAVHLDDLLRVRTDAAARSAERAVVEHVRARGVRPAENGAHAQSGVRTDVDLSRMSDRQLAALWDRAKRGEQVL